MRITYRTKVKILKGVRKFWNLYERTYYLNISIAAILFLVQIVHLYWLTTDVVFFRLFGESFFNPSQSWEYLLIIVDYTEIPAIITTSLVYVHALQKKFSWKPVWFLIFLNVQWLHILWITDEFVVSQFTGGFFASHAWLAWIAIFIDYLELPVIFDISNKFLVALGQRRLGSFAREFREMS